MREYSQVAPCGIPVHNKVSIFHAHSCWYVIIMPFIIIVCSFGIEGKVGASYKLGNLKCTSDYLLHLIKFIHMHVRLKLSILSARIAAVVS